MNNPLRHVGQTARPEDQQKPDSPADEEARRQNQTDQATAPAAGNASKPPLKKEIPDLEPGEPPPESSAGS